MLLSIHDQATESRAGSCKVRNHADDYWQAVDSIELSLLQGRTDLTKAGSVAPEKSLVKVTTPDIPEVIVMSGNQRAPFRLLAVSMR